MKLGAIFIVAILALAATGIGYAAWTDTITIEGQVNTGSVEWHFTEYSGTWVYKVPEGVPGADDPAHEIAIRHYSYPAGWNGPLMVNGWIYVASAYAEQGADDHHALVTFDNIFPDIDFEADVWVEYSGTVPGKINDVTLTPVDWPTGEGTLDWYTTLTIMLYNDDNVEGLEVPQEQLEGLQLHQGDRLHIVMTINLPQNNELMNMEGAFELTTEVVQWNEYPHQAD